MIRDLQKNKVYDFEDKYISSFNNITEESISFEEANSFVKMVWKAEDRKYPPDVITSNQFKCVEANANRSRICIKGTHTKRWIIIHEITHSLLWEMDNEGNFINNIAFHGPEFVTKYIKLLETYLKIPSSMLIWACSKEDIKML